jgi:hypothetical protein
MESYPARLDLQQELVPAMWSEPKRGEKTPRNRSDAQSGAGTRGAVSIPHIYQKLRKASLAMQGRA